MPLKKPSEYFSNKKLAGLSDLIDQQQDILSIDKKLREEVVPKVSAKASSTMLTDTFDNFRSFN